MISQSLIDAIDNPVLIKTEGGIVVACNEACAIMRNRSTRQMVGSTIETFVSQTEAQIHHENDRILLSSNSDSLEYLFSLRPTSNTLKLTKSIVQTQVDGPRLIMGVIHSVATKPSSITRKTNLTPREYAVLHLLVKGNTQKQIAQHLLISHHTVADHCKVIYQKLGVNTRTEAQLAAITRVGIIP